MASRSRLAPARLALYTALGYLAFGIAWILVSDRAVEAVASDVSIATRIQSLKGVAFVCVSALLVYALVRLLDRLPIVEAKLRASEERLANVLAAAHEGVIIYVDGRVAFANDAVTRMLRPDEQTDIIASFLRDSQPAQHRGGAYEVRLADDGGARWVSVAATPLAAPDGSIGGVLAFITDISARKADEGRIARLARLYTMLGQLNEAIVRVSDADALFAVACRIAIDEGGLRTAFVAKLDAQRAYLVPIGAAGPTHGVIGAEPIPLTAAHPGSGGAIASAIASGDAQIVSDMPNDPRTQYARTSTDALGIHSVAALPLRYDGRVVGALALYAPEQAFFDDEMVLLLRRMADDISFALESYARAAERDVAEAEVRALNATLERRVAERTAQLSEALRDLESFSYSASHDLRAPLRSINGFARVLQDEHGYRLDDEGRDMLARIVASSTRMAQLIDDLLSLAHVGRGTLDLQPIALSPVFDVIVEQARHAIVAKGARVVVASAMPVLRGDRTLLTQVFANLVNNALEYHRPGVPPQVDVAWRDLGDRIEITVRDDGIGIDPAHHQTIFEVFRRLHSQDEHPGTGIGLAIVAKAVSLLGGSIRVESEPGNGAAFIVELPKLPDCSDQMPTEACTKATERV